MKRPWSKPVRREWPELPAAGFIRGRAATVADVDSGEAVFCQQSDGGELAAPWPTDVPQYALWREETGAVIPTIVIQAEAHIHEPSEAIFGLQRTDGSTVVATASEVELLGQRRPD